jgi:ribosomal protein L16/L10AE
MKQFPNSLKFKKYQKLNLFNLKSLEIKKFLLNYGSIAIQSLEYGKLKFKQIESCRRTLKRGLKKIGNL